MSAVGSATFARCASGWRYGFSVLLAAGVVGRADGFAGEADD